MTTSESREIDLVLELEEPPAREPGPPPVAISGVDLGQDEKSYIAGRIHALIEAEVIDYQRERDAALRGETALAHQAPAFKVTLRDVPLPPKRLARLRARIRHLAVDQLGDRLPGGAAHRLLPIDGEGGNGGPGDESDDGGDEDDTGSFDQGLNDPGVCITVGSLPGKRLDLTQLIALGEPPLGDSFYIAIVDPYPNPLWPWQKEGDIIRMVIDRGVTQNLGPDDMIIGLANICPSGWAKEMYAYSKCGFRTGTVQQPHYNAIPSYLRLQRAAYRGPDTVVLRKPEFGGIWIDKLHFDPGQFWTALGSRIVKLTWAYD